MYSGKRGDGAVGDGVWQGAHADHDEQLEAVMLKRQGKSCKALVVGNKAVNVGLEQGAGENKGGGATAHCCGGSYEPTGDLSVAVLEYMHS